MGLRKAVCTFQFHLVEIRQLGGGEDGLLRLKTADHGVHQENVSQSLLHVLWVLKKKK